MAAGLRAAAISLLFFSFFLFYFVFFCFLVCFFFWFRVFAVSFSPSLFLLLLLLFLPILLPLLLLLLLPFRFFLSFFFGFRERTSKEIHFRSIFLLLLALGDRSEVSDFELPSFSTEFFFFFFFFLPLLVRFRTHWRRFAQFRFYESLIEFFKNKKKRKRKRKWRTRPFFHLFFFLKFWLTRTLRSGQRLRFRRRFLFLLSLLLSLRWLLLAADRPIVFCFLFCFFFKSIRRFAQFFFLSFRSKTKWKTVRRKSLHFGVDRP